MILLNEDALLVTPAKLDLGKLRVGEERRVAIDLRNIRSSGSPPITIAGFRTTCTCVSASGVPLILSEGESGQVVITIRAQGRANRVPQRVLLYVSGQRSGEVSVTASFEIDPVPPSRLGKDASARVEPFFISRRLLDLRLLATVLRQLMAGPKVISNARGG